MSPKQSKVVGFVSLCLGMLGILSVVCISQGIPLPGETMHVREGVTTLVPVIVPDAPLNIETDQVLAVASKAECSDESCELPPKKITKSAQSVRSAPRAGAARRRPPAVPGERDSARKGSQSLTVPGGAEWATDEALRYDPMNGEL